jgi:ribose 5-phosphate isomerase B
MKIAIATDHAGYPLKATLIEHAQALGHEVIDLGTHDLTAVDYPDFAAAAGRALQRGEADRAIVACGSGVGACISANKLRGVYAGVCHDTYSAHQAVEHDDMNMLCLGARIIGPEPAREIVASFLGARYLGNDPGQERHHRRVSKIRALEAEA